MGSPLTARICRSTCLAARDLWKRAPDCGCGDLNWSGCLGPQMSGSPGASDEANRVVYACLAALDLLEAGGEPLREKYPATGGLAAAFYGALRAVHGPRAGRPRLAYLLACAEAARRALEDLREKRSNFFGAEFRDRSPLSTLKNVERKVRQLTASSSTVPMA